MRLALANHSLATIGYQEYSRRLAFEYGDPLPAGVVLVAATAHYSWEKIVRALGIGSQPAGVRAARRALPHGSRRALGARARAGPRRQPILACVSVCGTTEESAVDRLDQVLEVRDRAERELGVTLPRPLGRVLRRICRGRHPAAPTAPAARRAEIQASAGSDWPDDDWIARASAPWARPTR